LAINRYILDFLNKKDINIGIFKFKQNLTNPLQNTYIEINYQLTDY